MWLGLASDVLGRRQYIYHVKVYELLGCLFKADLMFRIPDPKLNKDILHMSACKLVSWDHYKKLLGKAGVLRILVCAPAQCASVNVNP